MCNTTTCRLPFCHWPRHAYSRRTGLLLTRTADGSSAPGRREVIYLRIAQNYYENLKKNYYQITANQNLYILQQRLCCHHYFEHWFYVTWQRYEETKGKRKKKKRKKTYEATLQTQIWINRGVGSGWAAYGSGRAHPAIFFIIFSGRKVIKISHFPNKCAIFQ